jgi:prephenate dehydratase
VMSDCKLNLTKIQSLPKIETPWKYSFCGCHFEKYKICISKVVIEYYGRIFKVLGEYKNTK